MHKNNQKCYVFVLWLMLIGFFNPIHASSPSAVVAAHPLAISAGNDILDQGGNAFDAAIAISAVLAVVEPYASGLGGGGFWLLHHAETGSNVMIDGREMAPSNATKDMYLGDNGQPIPGQSLNGPLAAGIPGTPAALAHLSQFGRLTLMDNLQPAIELARNGFKLDRRFIQTLQNHQEKLSKYPETKAIFLPNNRLPVEGELFRQPQLAVTLSAIAQSGFNGFYQGPVARELVRSVQSAGGIWRTQDLENYRVIERKPVQFNYRNAQITTATLPSAGGLTLAQSLNILDSVFRREQNAIQRSHLIIEALRLSYRDRALLLGDSDFVSVPSERLFSKAYAAQQATQIDSDRAGVSQSIQSNSKLPVNDEGTETTHFAVMDKAGNRVAATLTINTFFGSGFVAGNTGVLLNNEMDDFSISEHVPNVFGLYGSRANAIEPGKRPLSSMSPTFVEHEQGVLIAGTPGGSRIISMLLLVILDFVDNQETNPQKLVALPRFHHQYLPDFVQIEPDSFEPQWIRDLESKGHDVQPMLRRWGNMQLIYYDKASKKATAASDPRGMMDTRY